jgi:hypothetical protein
MHRTMWNTLHATLVCCTDLHMIPRLIPMLIFTVVLPQVRDIAVCLSTIGLSKSFMHADHQLVQAPVHVQIFTSSLAIFRVQHMPPVFLRLGWSHENTLLFVLTRTTFAHPTASFWMMLSKTLFVFGLLLYVYASPVFISSSMSYPIGHPIPRSSIFLPHAWTISI